MAMGPLGFGGLILALALGHLLLQEFLAGEGGVLGELDHERFPTLNVRQVARAGSSTSRPP